MKFRKHIEPAAKSSRGRKPKLLGGSSRVNFWVEQPLLDSAVELISKWTSLGLTPKLNRSDLARIGFELAVKNLSKQLSDALKGKLHAKRR